MIATERISISDTDYLQAIGREPDEEEEFPRDGASDDVFDPAVLEQQLEEFEEDPPWLQPAPEREPARFQISVTLQDEWSIP